MLSTARINYLIRLFLDWALLFICFGAAVSKFSGNWQSIFQGVYCYLLMGSLLIWYLCARVFHFYISVTLFSFSQEMTIFIRVIFLHLLILVFLMALFLEDLDHFRSLVLVYHLLLLVTVPFAKYFYRVVIAFIRSQYKYVRNIVIVGTADQGANFYRSGMLINNLRFSIVGYLADTPTPQLPENYLGPIPQLAEILESKNIDEVFLSLPNSQVEQINYVVDCCEQKKVQLSVINDFSRLDSTSLRVTSYAGFPVVGLRYFPLDDPENRFFKRSFDIFFSLLVIVFVFSWLMPLLAVLIKLNSRGPVFFIQDRWGLNNKKIRCLKFRTMRLSNQEAEEPFQQASRNDTRVTAVGKILRKTSLDELPQFINVLLGDMSVVGPRPHPIPLSLESKDVVQHYMLRHLVKPGITGWAQVNGSRGEVQSQLEMRTRVAFDLWYIENWSFWLDCQIIFQTIVNLLKGDEKAY
jgi:putative colanic acid biosysnthesis UDP-glucose lipid carrier transferase